ncbi:MAG: host attachment protein [Alphaproteobacteria bacterium]|nr:host attachment protein [Alphaproteobacteria bacterium]
MFERTAHHQKKCTIWVLVADAKNAHVYEYLRTTQDIPLDGLNKNHLSHEKVRHELLAMDMGMKVDTHLPQPNDHAPQGDYKNDEKKRFTDVISDKLLLAFHDKKFNKIVLVAPPKMIGEFRSHMPSDLQQHIAGELSRDLTHFKGDELMAHLQETLDKVHVLD